MILNKNLQTKLDNLKANIQEYLDLDDNPHDTSSHAENASKVRMLDHSISKLEIMAKSKEQLHSFCQQLEVSQKALAKGEAASLAKELELLGNLFCKIPKEEQNKYKATLVKLSEKATPILASSTVIASAATSATCGDYHGGGWNPFVRICYYAPSCTIQYANLDSSSRASYTSDWARDDVNTALFKVFSWAVIYRIGKVFKSVQWVAAALGISNAVIQGYTGVHVRYRIKGETIKFHNWYGKHKYNAVTGTMYAVQFDGLGSAKKALIAPFTMEYGLFDSNNYCIGTTSEKWSMPGINIADYTVLPQRSFGTF